MNYPLLSEYIEAIKATEDNFEELKHHRPVLDEDGQPVMSSGNFAVVFKMKDEQTVKLHAVKCFLKDQEGRAEAYRLIAEELEYVSSTFLTPIRYLDKELFVHSSHMMLNDVKSEGEKIVLVCPNRETCPSLYCYCFMDRNFCQKLTEDYEDEVREAIFNAFVK